MDSVWNFFPAEVLKRASLRGNEYAWTIDDIPHVIEAARKANLVNIGGQLQFRLQNAICECYWVEVDTFKTVPTNVPYSERVARTADTALSDFRVLQSKFNFMDERRDFEVLSALTSEYLEAAMCFVWYVEKETRPDDD